MLTDRRQVLTQLWVHTHLHHRRLQHHAVERVVQFVTEAGEGLPDQREAGKLRPLALERFEQPAYGHRRRGHGQDRFRTFDVPIARLDG